MVLWCVFLVCACGYFPPLVRETSVTSVSLKAIILSRRQEEAGVTWKAIDQQAEEETKPASFKKKNKVPKTEWKYCPHLSKILHHLLLSSGKIFCVVDKKHLTSAEVPFRGFNVLNISKAPFSKIQAQKEQNSEPVLTVFNQPYLWSTPSWQLHLSPSPTQSLMRVYTAVP